jgi:hypothetical protein
MATVMQEPFPMLMRLYLFSSDGYVPVLPAEFLGGFAPCLQEITLSGIPFPELPALLLSASDLVKLELRGIPPTGYISPEAMVVGLAALPRLETFIIEFQPVTRRPNRIHPPSVARTVLLALTFFHFQGASEYLEDLVSRIDSPQLDQVHIDYLNQLVDVQVAQLSKFINRSVGPILTSYGHARVTLFDDKISFNMNPHEIHPTLGWPRIRTSILCQGIDWQVSHMAQLLSQFSAISSNAAHLKLGLEAQSEEDCQLEGMDDVEWLHFLHQFSTVQSLHVSRNLAGHISLALEDITEEMVAEVLPSLGSICLVGQPASSIKKFISVRQLSGRPVIVNDMSGRWGCLHGDCKATFRRHQELKRHVVHVHMPPRRCPFCLYTWRRPHNIKTHLIENHRDKFLREVLDEIPALGARDLVQFL